MSKAKIELNIPPRMASFHEVCAVLGRSDEWVREHLNKWKKEGHPFPKRHPFTNNYDLIEVNKWLDKTRDINLLSDNQSLLDRTNTGNY